MISAIVLAAGKSERMGRPKALLRTGNTTFLESVLTVIQNSSIGFRVVVLGHHRNEILEAIAIENCVYNDLYEQGMTTSFQAGIRFLPAGSDGAVLFLVDHPAPSVATIEALIGRSRPGNIVVPVYRGRRGHPVLFSREVLHEVSVLEPSQGANTVVRRVPDRVVEVRVEDRAVIEDIDTPEDFRRWSGQ